MNNSTTTANIKKTVLIIDDDKVFLKDFVERITSAGFNGVGAYSGKEALDYIATNNVDFIVLDFIMPEMDGYTFYHIMTHDMKKNIPTIVLTNMVQPPKVPEGIEAFVKNQTNLDDLVAKIKTYLLPSTS